MKRAPQATIAAATMLAACTTTPVPDPQLLARTEIDVYTAAYKAYTDYDPHSTSTDTLYVSAQFNGGGEIPQVIEFLRKDVGEEIARAYAEANRTPERHAGPPTTRRKTVVFGVDSLMPYESPMHAPVLEFSRPGFNAQGDSALIQMGFGCGLLCGSWEMMLLAKGKDGRWYMVKSFNHAVS